MLLPINTILKRNDVYKDLGMPFDEKFPFYVSPYRTFLLTKSPMTVMCNTFNRISHQTDINANSLKSVINSWIDVMEST